MARKPIPKPDDPEQSKRFIETAKEVGADEDAEALERTFSRLTPKSAGSHPTLPGKKPR